MKKSLYHHQSGSALLIAILVMGVLLLLTVGLSDLIIREIHQTQDAVASGEAYFSAESGVENALLDLRQNLPGYEVRNYKDVKNDSGEEEFHYRYRILNSADKVPYFDTGKALFLNPSDAGSSPALAVSSDAVYDIRPDATYNVLGLNESVVIPLSGNYGDVQDFLIEYYFKFDPNNNNLTPDLTKNLDILRWKIYGYPNPPAISGSTKTDAISDFFPASKESNETHPMCIGTDESLSTATPNTTCLFPVLAKNSDNRSSSGIASTQEENSANLWSAARTCYQSDADNSVQSSSLAEIQTADQGGCTIKNFIQHHTKNYLVLINYVNPDTIGLTNLEVNAGKANIYYRIVAKPRQNDDDQTTPQLIREAAAISADGFAKEGKIQQSIDAHIGLSSFLPVFHFSLYRTNTSTPLRSATETAPSSTARGL